MPEHHRIGDWTFRWAGGRTADIFHASDPARAIDCVQAGAYDWQAGRSLATPATFREACEAWVAAHGAEHYHHSVEPRLARPA